VVDLAVAGTARAIAGSRFNLPAIEAGLRELQRAFPRINPVLSDRREPLDDDVLQNLLAGYAYVDEMLAADLDLFAMGNLKHWLELNFIVLCGRDPARRTDYAKHLRATEQRFYDDAEGGIRDVAEWYQRHQHRSVWRRAAGLYIRVISEPQLFLEGNHRTGTLMMSYVLAREGKPPLIVSPDYAQDFFDPSTILKKTRKRTLAMLINTRGLTGHFAQYLRQQASKDYLRHDNGCQPVSA
jgi:prophage maintenance system killer protein